MFKGMESAVLFMVLCITKNLLSHLIRVGHSPDFGLPSMNECAESDVKQYSLTRASFCRDIALIVQMLVLVNVKSIYEDWRIIPHVMVLF